MVAPKTPKTSEDLMEIASQIWLQLTESDLTGIEELLVTHIIQSMIQTHMSDEFTNRLTE